MNNTELNDFNESLINDRQVVMSKIRLHQKQVDKYNKSDESNIQELNPDILSNINRFLTQNT